MAEDTAENTENITPAKENILNQGRELEKSEGGILGASIDPSTGRMVLSIKPMTKAINEIYEKKENEEKDKGK